MTERRRRSRRWLWPLVVALVLVPAAALTIGLRLPLVLVLLLAVGAVTVWALLRLRAERTEHAVAMARRDAAEAVLAERLSLARDVHDLVSHGLGMITVRAAAATHLYTRRPDEKVLHSALQDVEAISRDATLELRRMLQALRESDTEPARHPTDTLASLSEIVDSARRAGLKVAVQQDELGPVSGGVQVAICRVVREGLTNCAHHAGSTTVDIRLRRTRTGIGVTITDGGPARGWLARPGAGHGLIGLRERIAALGGTLSAGPALEGPAPEGPALEGPAHEGPAHEGPAHEGMVHEGRTQDRRGERTGFRLDVTIPDAAA